MNWQFIAYFITIPVAAFTSLAIGVFSWRKQNTPGARTFAILMFITSAWASVSSLELISQDMAFKLWWGNLRMTLLILTPPAWLIFALSYAGRRRWLNAANRVLIFALPVLSVLFLWTNPWHHWFYQIQHFQWQENFLLLTGWEAGGYFWVHVLVSYVEMLLGILVLISAVTRQHHTYRQQVSLIIIALTLPVVITALRAAQMIPSNPDWTPLSFSLTGAAIALGMFRFRLFDLVPVARDMLVENTPDGMLVIDRHERVVDINPAAERLLNLKRRSITGLSLEQVLPDALLVQLPVSGQGRSELVLEQGGQNAYYDVRTSQLRSLGNQPSGRLIVLRDVTDRVRLLEEARLLAITDPLTGLYNRRHFMDLAHQAYARAQRYQRPLTVLMLDLDHFKQINDNCGHAAGDQVLRLVADLCRTSLRESDLLGRYGGEEFVFLLPETDVDGAVQTAERLRAEIAAQQFDLEDCRVTITASLGIAGILPETTQFPLERLLDLADEAMYAAKRAGRDRVVRIDQLP